MQPTPAVAVQKQPMSPMTLFFVILGALIAFTFILFEGCGLLLAGAIDEANTQSSFSAPTERIVTMGDYNAVKEGMSYEQVVAIIGAQGEESFSGETMTIYTWTNPGIGGGAMTATFREGRLRSKGQFMLEH
jgi:hypothetical protein